MTDRELGAATAHLYARLGYRVFRCVGKRPACRWKTGATNDASAVARMFRSKKDDNVGIVVPENALVLDVDVPKRGGGETADARLEQLCDALNIKVPSECPRCRTGSGGLHVWFRLPEGVHHGTAPGNLPEGFDVRAGGKGYVIAPESVHPDTREVYRWERELAPADELPYVPPPLLAVIRKKASVPGMVEADLARHTERACDELRRAAEGERNAVLNRVAYTLAGLYAGAGRSPEDARGVLTETASDIGLDADEIDATLGSAFRKGVERPLAEPGEKIPANPESYMRFLARPEFEGALGFNERANRVEVLKRLPWSLKGERIPRALEDVDGHRFAVYMNERMCPGARSNPALEALSDAARHNTFDPVRDYLESLPAWDEERRIDSWLVDFCGVDDTPLHRAYGRKLAIAAVARVYEPGCKVDTCLVLTGAQGCGKSTGIEALFGRDFYSDSRLDFSDDVRLRMAIHQGQWGHEIAEIDQFRKVDQAQFKDLLSTSIDRYTPKYGRLPIERPRRSVFIGTSNSDEILRDATGSRRYWPIRVGAIDVVGVRSARDGLWAEALHAYRSGESWHLDAAEERQREICAADFEVELAGYESVSQYVRDERPAQVSLDDVRHLLPRVGLTGTPARHLGLIMAALGWDKTRPRVKGAKVMIYTPPADFYTVRPADDYTDFSDY